MSAGLKAKVLAVLLMLSIVPLAIIGVVGTMHVQGIGQTAYDDSTKALKDSAEDDLAQRAKMHAESCNAFFADVQNEVRSKCAYFSGLYDEEYANVCDHSGLVDGIKHSIHSGTYNGSFSGSILANVNGALDGSVSVSSNCSFVGTLDGTQVNWQKGARDISGRLSGNISGRIEGIINCTFVGTLDGVIDGRVNAQVGKLDDRAMLMSAGLEQSRDANANLMWTYVGAPGYFVQKPWDATPGADAVVGVDYDCTSRDWYIKTAAERKLVWSDVYGDYTTHELMVTCAAPVMNGSSLAGIVGMDVLIKTLVESVMNVHITKSSYAFMLNDRGFVVAHPDETEWNRDYRATNNSQFNTIVVKMLAGQANTEVCRIGGKDSYVAYYPINSTSWSLAIVVPVEEIINPAKETGKKITESASNMVMQFLAVNVMAIALAFAVGWVLAGSIVAPIKHLTDVADRVSKGDMAVSINIRSSDEIGSLAESFKRLVNSTNVLMQQVETEDANRHPSLVPPPPMPPLRGYAPEPSYGQVQSFQSYPPVDYSQYPQYHQTSALPPPELSLPPEIALRLSNNPAELSREGQLLKAEGRLVEAMQRYDKLLLIDPRNFDAWFNKGLCFKFMKKHADAVGCFNKALELNPNFAPASDARRESSDALRWM